jgi:hypothetical protein
LLPLLAPMFVGIRVLVALPMVLLVSIGRRLWAPENLAPLLSNGLPESTLIYFGPLNGAPRPYSTWELALFVQHLLPGELFAFALGLAAANLHARLEARSRKRRPRPRS